MERWFIVVPAIFLLFNTVAIVAVFLIRKADWNEKDQRFSALVFNVYGIIYALFLGFITFSVWERFNDVRGIVQNEGKYIVDLYRDAIVFPEFSENNIQGQLKDYLEHVIDHEWQQQPFDQTVREGDRLVDDIWQAYYAYTPQTTYDQIWYRDSITKLGEFTNARMMRIYNSKSFVGIAIWTLLIGGGLVLVIIPSFFKIYTLPLKLILTFFLANLIAFMLFIIYSLDHPFSGYAEIDNLPFKYALETVQPW